MAVMPEAGPVWVYELVPGEEPIRKLVDAWDACGILLRVVDSKTGTDHPHTTWNRSRPTASPSAEAAVGKRAPSALTQQLREEGYGTRTEA